MELNKTKLKLITGILASLLVLSVVGNIYYWSRETTQTSQDDQEVDDSSTSLFSQDEEVARIKKQMAEIEGKNGLLAEKVQDLNGMLKEANNQVWELRNRKGSSAAEFYPVDVRSRTSLGDSDAMFSTNEQLKAQIAALQDSLQQLKNPPLTADNFRMVAFKRNSKETAKAKKVDRLTISLKVPSATSQQDSETIFLNLTDLEGKGISSPLETLTLEGQRTKKTVSVHDKKVVELSKQSAWKEVTFDMQQLDNIHPGTYRASLYTKNKYLGSVEVQFRDSFWIF
jgi:dynactin complex subunit